MRDALEERRPEFVARAARPLPRRRAIVLALVGAAGLAFALFVVGNLLEAAFEGTLEMSTNDDPSRPVEPSDPITLAFIGGVGLILAMSMGLTLGSGLHGLLAQGPWVVGTSEGLHVVGARTARFHPWDRFASVRPEGGGVVLHARPSIRLHLVHLGRDPDRLELPHLDDADRVHDACARHIQARTTADATR